MADNTEKTIFEFGIDFNAVTRAYEVIRRKGDKFWKGVTKSGDKYSKTLKKMAKDSSLKKMFDTSSVSLERYSNTLKKVAKDTGKMFDSSTDGLDVFQKDFRSFETSIKKFNVLINAEQKKLSTATLEESAAIKEQIELLKKGKELKLSQGSKRDRAKLDASGADIKKSAVEGAKAAYFGGMKFLKRDFEGAFEDGAKVIGKGIETGFHIAGKKASKFGGKLQQYGLEKHRQAREKGGEWSALGGVSKALGGIMKGIGPMLNMVAKLGPLLEVAASSLLAIVKLMIDAEAQAKELNKQVLQVSGTSGLWYKNAKRSGAALADMGDVLGKIRDDATSLSNISWGINKDDHMAVLSTLAAEGVRVTELTDQFDELRKNTKYADAQAKSFGGTVQVAVAYSRQFGVSLQEISQFQAEMMTEMGANLAEVQVGFHSMSQAADDSGIAANKFFGIIRSLSSDMSLYNSRMEDAVKILGKLGKVMSPKSAQKFMSNLMQGFKNKGRTDLVKMNLLNDGKGQGVVEKDVQRKADSLAGKIGPGVTGKDVLGGKSTEELLKGVAKESQGSIREAIMELRTDASMNKKGMFGSSMAMGNLSPGAAAQMTENALTRFGSKNKDGSRKKLGDVAGEIGPEMMAENLGISREQLMAQVKFATALDEQRDELKKGLKDDTKRAATLDKLKKAGIDASKIDSAGYDDILSTMDEDTQKQLKESSEEIDYAKRTSEHTSDVMQKLQTLIDFMMNQLYKVMLGIWDAVLDLAEKAGAGNAGDRQRAKLEAMALKTGNTSLVEMASKSASQDDFKKKLLDSDTFKSVLAPLKDNSVGVRDKIDDLTKQRDASSSTAERKMLEDQLEVLTKRLDSGRNAKDDLLNKVDQQLGGSKDGLLGEDGWKGERYTLMNQAIEEAMGKGNHASDRFKNGGGTVSDAMEGYSESDQAKILEKLMAKMSPDQLLRMVPKGSGGPIASTTTPGAPTASTSTAPVTTKQAEEHTEAVTQVQEAIEQADTNARTKGVKMDKTFTKNVFWAEGKKAVLEATREALFEYFMYKELDPAEVAKGMEDGEYNGSNFATKVIAARKGEPMGQLPQDYKDLKGFATGGTIPSPKSPDSVFVAARPGETILPKGSQGQGGGSTITIPITVNGSGSKELGDMIRASTINTIQEWQRKQKYQ
jgi:hypothetical protein